MRYPVPPHSPACLYIRNRLFKNGQVVSDILACRTGTTACRAVWNLVPIKTPVNQPLDYYHPLDIMSACYDISEKFNTSNLNNRPKISNLGQFRPLWNGRSSIWWMETRRMRLYADEAFLLGVQFLLTKHFSLFFFWFYGIIRDISRSIFQDFRKCSFSFHWVFWGVKNTLNPPNLPTLKTKNFWNSDKSRTSRYFEKIPNYFSEFFNSIYFLLFLFKIILFVRYLLSES